MKNESELFERRMLETTILMTERIILIIGLLLVISSLVLTSLAQSSSDKAGDIYDEDDPSYQAYQEERDRAAFYYMMVNPVAYLGLGLILTVIAMRTGKRNARKKKITRKEEYYMPVPDPQNYQNYPVQQPIQQQMPPPQQQLPVRQRKKHPVSKKIKLQDDDISRKKIKIRRNKNESRKYGKYRKTG